MENLIELRDASINGEMIPAVNARELHGILEVRTRFNDWIQRRIEDGGFVEGEDYSILSKGSPDCLVSLDMAKHISMLERNEKGKEARQYFIECEKRLHMIAAKPMTPEEMIILQAQSVLEVKKKVEEQQALLAEQQHKLLECETRINSLDNVNINGVPRQILNVMIRKYARVKGVNYSNAWHEFVQAFNLAFGTNLKLALQHFKKKKRDATIPEYLEAIGKIEDAIRVADKLLAA